MTKYHRGGCRCLVLLGESGSREFLCVIQLCIAPVEEAAVSDRRHVNHRKVLIIFATRSTPGSLRGRLMVIIDIFLPLFVAASADVEATSAGAHEWNVQIMRE